MERPIYINEEDMARLGQLLKERINIDLGCYKHSTLERRLAKRVQDLQLGSFGQYMERLCTHEGEAQALLDELLITVTHFFRDEDLFISLKNEVLPLLFKRAAGAGNDGGGVRIWVAGCSSGEEAYSIAMLINELQGKESFAATPFKIFASDLSSKALGQARMGKYLARQLENVSEERRRRFFTKKDGAYFVKDLLRKQVLFCRQDVIQDPPFSKVDIIFCRNLLIYLKSGVQQKVIKSFLFALKQRGMLVLGKSETVDGSDSGFKVLDKELKVYQKSRSQHFPISSSGGYKAPEMPVQLGGGQLPLFEKPRSVMDNPNQRIPFQNLVYRRYTPPVVVIDDKFMVHFISSEAQKYIEMPNNLAELHNILHLVPEELAVLVNALMSKMKAEPQDCVYGNLAVSFGGLETSLEVSLEAFHNREGKKLFSVVLKEAKLPKSSEGHIGADTVEICAVLQAELENTRLSLNASISQLEGANQSLMASNEELQSAYEELQSANEELQTINSDYQNTIKELSEANRDINHLLNETHIATIFLNENLFIRKYTQATEEIINIQMGDLARPLGDITTRLRYHSLVADAQKVLKDNEPFETEVQHLNGQWYLMRILPYNPSLTDKLGGVVINFININQLRAAERALRVSRERYNLLFEYSHLGIVAIDDHMKFTKVNKAFCRLTGYSEEELYQLHMPDLRAEGHVVNSDKLIAELMKGEKRGEDFEKTFARKDGSIFHSQVSVTAIFDEDGNFLENVAVIRDITEQKEAERVLVENEALFRSLFEESPIGMIMEVKSDGIMKGINNKFAEMLNYPLEELEGKTVREITHPDDWHLLDKANETFSDKRNNSCYFEQRYVKKDGCAMWASVSVSAIRVADGDLDYEIAMIQDITERKKAESEQKRLIEIIEATPDIISYANPETGNVAYMNKAGKKLLGLSEDEDITRLTIEDFHPAEMHDMIKAGLQTAIIKGYWKAETAFLSRDGKAIPTSQIIVSHKDEDGQILYSSTVARDISNVKKTEEALRKSEMQYRDIFENVNDAIVMLDKNDRITLTNKAGLSLLDIDRFQPISIPDILHPTSARNSEKYFQDLKKNGQYNGYQGKIISKKGKVKDIEVNSSAIFDENGNFVGSRDIIRDITEKKKAETALRESEELFRSLYENSPIGIVMLDEQNIIMKANAKFCSMLGYSEGQMVSRDMNKFTIGGVLGNEREMVGSIEKGKSNHYNIDKQFVKKKGDIIWARMAYAVVRNETGGIKHAIAMVEDITERKLAEQTYYELFENSRDLLYIMDDEGKMINVNKAVCNSYGYAKEELINKTPVEVLAAPEGNDYETIQTEVETCLAGGKPANFLWTGKRKSGETFLKEVYINRGKYFGQDVLIGFGRDVTERERNRLQLLQTNALLETTINSTHTAILVANGKGNMDYFNKQFREMWKIPKEHLEAKNEENALKHALSQLVDPQKFIDKVRELYGEPEVDSYDLLQFKDGRIVERYSMPHRIDGKIAGRVWSFIDITDKKQTEEALRKSEAIQRAMLSALPDLTFRVTTRGVIIGYYAPPASQKSELYIPPEAFLGKKLSETMPPYVAKQAMNAIGLTMSDGEVASFDYSLPMPDKTRHYEARINAVNNNEVIVAVRDISELKETESQLIEKLDELDRKNQELERYIESNVELENFAYIASHDLREPLRTIISFTQILERNYLHLLDEEGVELMDFVTKAAGNMNQLIIDLLAYSRVNTHTQKAETINCRELLENVLQSLHKNIEEKNATVKTDNLPDVLEGSNVKLKQLFQNLIANSLKFGKPNQPPVISIGCENSGEFHLFSISDNGIGIRPEYHKRIFELFRKLHASNEYDGTGMGLAICKKIVNRHGGQIWVESEEGAGTTFKFTLPKTQSDINL